MYIMQTKVALITGGTLPVPNTEGGAVEALDMNLIKENSKHTSCEITVFSIYTQDAADRANKYKLKNVIFQFIRIPTPLQILDKIIYSIAKALHRNNLMGYRYIFQRLWFLKKVSQYLAKSSTFYEKIIIENSAASFRIFKNKINFEKYKGKVYFHLHNEVYHTFGYGKQLHTIKKVLGVSNFITDSFDTFLREKTGKGLDTDQKTRWLTGIDISRFDSRTARSQGERLRKDLGVNDNDIVYMFAGRLTREKGALELLQAFKKNCSKSA